ncbi:hypothetical protein [Rhabdothermincola sediminis]|uniref:hypothetical protein n=1 Tax=Rhabdothermincola sediminis TaxID=2751370 RepID=UPI001AA09F5E|nr:hypothetical protein [Rhabdothermincola sediminis]
MNRKTFKVPENWQEMTPEEKDEFLEAVLDEAIGPVQEQPSLQPSTPDDESEAGDRPLRLPRGGKGHR